MNRSDGARGRTGPLAAVETPSSWQAGNGSPRGPISQGQGPVGAGPSPTAAECGPAPPVAPAPALSTRRQAGSGTAEATAPS